MGGLFFFQVERGEISQPLVYQRGEFIQSGAVAGSPGFEKAGNIRGFRAWAHNLYIVVRCRRLRLSG